MPFRAFPIFLSWAFACGTNWVSAVVHEAPPGCFAGDDGASCQFEEPHGTAEADDQDGVSQLQVRQSHPDQERDLSCEKLIPEVSNECSMLDFITTFKDCPKGGFDNDKSVLKLPF